MKVRGFFEQWLEAINTHEANNAPLFKPSSTDGYMRSMKVHQLRKDTSGPDSPAKLRSYELMFAFPTSISQIDLAYDSNDQIEEFTVEFQYSYWKAIKGTEAEVSQIEIKK